MRFKRVNLAEISGHIQVGVWTGDMYESSVFDSLAEAVAYLEEDTRDVAKAYKLVAVEKDKDSWTGSRLVSRLAKDEWKTVYRPNILVTASVGKLFVFETAKLAMSQRRGEEEVWECEVTNPEPVLKLPGYSNTTCFAQFWGGDKELATMPVFMGTLAVDSVKLTRRIE